MNPRDTSPSPDAPAASASPPSSATPPSPLPLQGCLVIEMGHSIAGPFAGQILGDLGAQVIKIEKAKGDDARHWGPPFVDGASATFRAMNRNKRSVVVDLRDALQIAALRQLTQTRADAVVQNMRPGQVDALGLDAATLTALNPRLVYCNMGAFGAAGPLANKPGYDPLMQAFGGIMSVVGEPGSAPVRVGPSIIDMGCGLWAALGVVAALHRRHATGRGGIVDVSLFETAIGWMGMYCAQYLAGGQMPTKQGSGQVGIVPYRAYRTADGDLVVAAGNDSLFASLCGVLGHAEWTTDPRFASNPQRVAHAPALYALLEPCFLQATSAQWTQRLEQAGVPCAPVQDVGQMLAHPQTLATGMLQQVAGSSIPLVGLPLSLDSVRPVPRSAPPALGEAGSLHDLIAELETFHPTHAPA